MHNEMGKKELLSKVQLLGDVIDDRWAELTNGQVSQIWETLRNLESSLCRRKADRRAK